MMSRMHVAALRPATIPPAISPTTSSATPPTTPLSLPPTTPPGLSSTTPPPAPPTAPRLAGVAGLSAGSAGRAACCPGDHPRQADLTRRERDVLPYLVSGKSNKYISIELSISSRTAEAHRANILRKMGVRSTMELACRVCPHRQARE